MLLHEVTLRNIRSYESGTVQFENGITLFAGDIGAGKSTILQAIEFAFFGIARGGLEGDGLLRHGTNDGWVTVAFTIEKNRFLIRRSLKRTAQGVRQTDGSLETNGVKEDLSPLELKARMLELFGYPEQLLARSKGMIFRHTVYTPQEEMKQIIFMPNEDRLNTLRLLFGIEKYKTVQENALILTRELRADERRYAPQAVQLEQLSREHEAALVREQTAAEQAASAHEAAKVSSSEVHRKRQEALQARAAYELELEQDKRRELLALREKELLRSITNIHEDLTRAVQYLHLPLEPVEDSSAALESSRSTLDAIETQLLASTRELAELQGTNKVLSEQARRIASLDSCPVCAQPVSADHKHSVAQRAIEQQTTAALRSSALRATEQALQMQKTKLQADMQRHHEQQRRFASYQKELLARKEHEAQQARLLARQAAARAELEGVYREVRALPAQRSDLKDAVRTSQAELAQAEALLQSRMELLGAARENLGRTQAQCAALADRMKEAAAAQQQLASLQSTRVWLEESFIPLVQRIEQHVLASLHAEFRMLFEQWFARLVGDDSLSVSLGERFEPLARQNGYDAPLEGLSGGEKTAVALSYRLSLYRVVSDFVSTIRTKDLLILDEPTDGFSTEQLDRVRDVLRELGCEQVILVSHEPQMETCADHVVRIEKHAHRSVPLA